MPRRVSPRVRTPFAAGALAIVAGIAASWGGSGADPTPAAAAASCRTGTYDVALTSAGKRRTARVHIPRQAGSKPQPLYLVLHFAGGTGAQMEGVSGFDALGDRRGFVVAYPDALPRSRPFWNATEAGSKPDDVAFARGLVDLLAKRGCADPARVYATGVSNGASMSYLLACRLGDRLVGIAPVAGSYLTDLPCDPPRPLSILEIHGTGDTVAPYGGREGRTMSVPDFLAAWRTRDRCPATGTRKSMPRVHATRFDWGPCDAGSRVAHLRLTGAGHGLPPNPPLQGKRSKLDASRAVADFFTP
jgi:polyhydroxybutyrate depolymerase